MRVGWSWLLAICFSLNAACDGSNECTKGESVGCACPDGSEGAQVCLEDGTFDECVCSDGSSTTTTGSAGTGATTSGTGGATSSSTATGAMMLPCWRCCCQDGNQLSCEVPPGVNPSPTCPMECDGTCPDQTPEQCLSFDCNMP